MKRPRSSLFTNRQAPWPSCQMTLIRSPRRPRKTKRRPLAGSRFSVSCTSSNRRGKPLRMSTCPVASQTHTPSGPGSSAPIHNGDDPRQSLGIDTGVDNDPPTVRQDDLHARGCRHALLRRQLRCRCEHRGDERRHGIRTGWLVSKSPPPCRQLRSRYPVATCRRRHEPRGRHALDDDLQLLLVAPATTPTHLDDLKPLKGSVRIPVHPHCSQAENISPARRPSPQAYG